MSVLRRQMGSTGGKITCLRSNNVKDLVSEEACVQEASCCWLVGLETEEEPSY